MAPFRDPEIYRDILDSLQIGVSVLDLESKIVFWSDGAEEITGYTRIDVLGHSYTDNILQHCDQKSCEMCSDHCPIGAAFHNAKPVETVGSIHHKSGYRTPVHVWAIPLRDQHGSIIGIIQTFEGEEAIHGPDPQDRHLKEHGWLDEITGLLNHTMMQSHLSETLGTFSALGIPFGIATIEMPQLGQFRGRYGEGATRAILQVLARSLRNAVWPTDFVGRWSDNRFLVILMGCNEDSLHAVAARILHMMAGATIRWWGEELSAAVACGHTATLPGDTVESLLQRAISGERAALPNGGVATPTRPGEMERI
jgi:PAS domain S-box-containing protein/diguanylate cyclase (GGDEF)-like protein